MDQILELRLNNNDGREFHPVTSGDFVNVKLGNQDMTLNEALESVDTRIDIVKLLNALPNI